jgi:hypothetical protein
VVPAFLHNLEVFEGRGGAKSPTFEAFHHSTAHTSPLLFDVDLDGVPDIVLGTYDGEILFFKDTVRRCWGLEVRGWGAGGLGGWGLKCVGGVGLLAMDDCLVDA